MWKRKEKLLGQAYGDVKKIDLLNQQFIYRYLDAQATPYSLCYRAAMPSQRNFLFGIAATGHGHINGLQQFEPVKSTHPYCHRPLVEFVAAIPRRQLCGIGRPRDLMRRAFTGILPRSVLDRRTKALSSSASDKSMLEILPALSRGALQTEIRGYIDGPNFRRILQNPQATDYDRNQLMQAVMLEVWLRTRRSPKLSYLEEARVGEFHPPLERQNKIGWTLLERRWNEMQYIKPELNVIGSAEGLVLGPSPNGIDGGNAADQNGSAAFEFED
jgi:hypothetical protein